MTKIQAQGLDHKALNNAIRDAGGDCVIEGCLGQRFIASGMSGLSVDIHGVPGNALGAYLNGATISVEGNAQDAVGDTMNEGLIAVHGNIGDAAGYAMRGGRIYVKGNAGYRAGIHMKAFHEKFPVMIIGGRTGSFLGEYQAGGVIVVLNLEEPAERIVGNFPCTGMHGGKMFLRSDCRDITFPAQVTARPAEAEDIEELTPYLNDYCEHFGLDLKTVLDAPFTVVTPDSRNPYRQMYVAN
ncbi:MAG: glutamate synthase [Lachnospiraceae bacterium]|nr:glutamate synthase [Lachnospiraceae bacterium]